MIFWIVSNYLFHLFDLGELGFTPPKYNCIWLDITEARWNYYFSMVWVEKYITNIKNIQNFLIVSWNHII